MFSPNTFNTSRRFSSTLNRGCLALRLKFHAKEDLFPDDWFWVETAKILPEWRFYASQVPCVPGTVVVTTDNVGPPLTSKVVLLLWRILALSAHSRISTFTLTVPEHYPKENVCCKSPADWLHATCSFWLLNRCGESIVVLNEGLLHINQATQLAKVS